MSSLELAAVGNCSIAALIDSRACIVWGCFPRLDGDPAFCALVNGAGAGETSAEDQEGGGYFSIELEGCCHISSAYVENTAVLSTTMSDDHGNVLEVIDLAPRFIEHERTFRPPLLLRRIIPISGRPRIKVRLRPLFDKGATRPDITRGSNHVRFISADQALRLTSNAPISYVLDETPFVVDRPLELFFGSDERIQSDIGRLGRELHERTVAFWQTWVRSLSIPFDWQEATIRAAIALKICNFEETGAVVAALTTSIPEAPGTARNWDYRFCWLRDAYFVINALNRLGATRTMENYIRYINDVADDAIPDRLRPVYGITRNGNLDEVSAEALAGYRGFGPVRFGNAAYEQVQNDVYGSVILASTHAFFDRRLERRSDGLLFERLENLGVQAVESFDKPDAGPWELRTSSSVHTFSGLMCWAACDRLAKIAARIGRTERARYWRARADQLHRVTSVRAWSVRRGTFVSTFEGNGLDASLLLMAELGFIEPKDPRFLATVTAIEHELKRDGLLYRYTTEDDFGFPSTAFVICSFWYVNALAAIGRQQEARELFEQLLKRRNSFGLLFEDIDARTGELWGNFPQTYSMVGLINSAVKLSRRWEDML